MIHVEFNMPIGLLCTLIGLLAFAIGVVVASGGGSNNDY